MIIVSMICIFSHLVLFHVSQFYYDKGQKYKYYEIFHCELADERLENRLSRRLILLGVLFHNIGAIYGTLFNDLILLPYKLVVIFASLSFFIGTYISLYRSTLFHGLFLFSAMVMLSIFVAFIYSLIPSKIFLIFVYYSISYMIFFIIITLIGIIPKKRVNSQETRATVNKKINRKYHGFFQRIYFLYLDVLFLYLFFII